MASGAESRSKRGAKSQEESPRKKLRNRETIAKPDSLQYEPNLNKGYHSKLIENLYSEPRSRNKKSESISNPQSKKPTKRRSESQPVQGKKAKAAIEETEPFDSYSFSLSLINGQVDTSEDKTTKEKYVLFVGNLPHDVSREQLEDHFRKAGGIKAIRIPKERGTDTGKGFAYMEFESRISHGLALRLHHTTMGDRKITVEFHSVGKVKAR